VQTVSHRLSPLSGAGRGAAEQVMAMMKSIAVR
jgi:hypothetical protein